MHEMIRTIIDSVDETSVVSLLSVVDNKPPPSPKKRKGPDSPMFSWIFRNLDFANWRDASDSRVLWLSGPQKCNISQASSYIVDQQKKTHDSVLYYFCSASTRGRSAVGDFVRTLLHQIIESLPQARRTTVLVRFLHVIRVGIFETESVSTWTDFKFNPQLFPHENIEKLLEAQPYDLWMALESVLTDEPGQDLIIVVDGLDKISIQERELLQEVWTFLEHLYLRMQKIKVLLTGQRNDHTKDIVDGLQSIEYDKERRGQV